MPIYEFYCPACHTILNFYSWKVDTETSPACPRCKKNSLQRQASVFAVTGRAKEDKSGTDGMPPMDEAKMEKAMQALEREAGGLDENDPKQAARLMRKLTDMTGMEMGGTMKEALKRLESGEDPEQVEADLGPRLEGEEPFVTPDKKGKPGKRPPPRRDQTLYEMN
jgi:putative FmdB family regulatory protein